MIDEFSYDELWNWVESAKHTDNYFIDTLEYKEVGDDGS